MAQSSGPISFEQLREAMRGSGTEEPAPVGQVVIKNGERFRWGGNRYGLMREQSFLANEDRYRGEGEQSKFSEVGEAATQPERPRWWESARRRQWQGAAGAGPPEWYDEYWDGPAYHPNSGIGRNYASGGLEMPTNRQFWEAQQQDPYTHPTPAWDSSTPRLQPQAHYGQHPYYRDQWGAYAASTPEGGKQAYGAGSLFDPNELHPGWPSRPNYSPWTKAYHHWNPYDTEEEFKEWLGDQGNRFGTHGPRYPTGNLHADGTPIMVPYWATLDQQKLAQAQFEAFWKDKREGLAAGTWKYKMGAYVPAWKMKWMPRLDKWRDWQKNPEYVNRRIRELETIIAQNPGDDLRKHNKARQRAETEIRVLKGIYPTRGQRDPMPHRQYSDWYNVNRGTYGKGMEKSEEWSNIPTGTAKLDWYDYVLDFYKDPVDWGPQRGEHTEKWKWYDREKKRYEQRLAKYGNLPSSQERKIAQRLAEYEEERKRRAASKEGSRPDASADRSPGSSPSSGSPPAGGAEGEPFSVSSPAAYGAQQRARNRPEVRSFGGSPYENVIRDGGMDRPQRGAFRNPTERPKTPIDRNRPSPGSRGRPNVPGG